MSRALIATIASKFSTVRSTPPTVIHLMIYRSPDPPNLELLSALAVVAEIIHEDPKLRTIQQMILLIGLMMGTSVDAAHFERELQTSAASGHITIVYHPLDQSDIAGYLDTTTELFGEPCSLLERTAPVGNVRYLHNTNEAPGQVLGLLMIFIMGAKTRSSLNHKYEASRVRAFADTAQIPLSDITYISVESAATDLTACEEMRATIYTYFLGVARFSTSGGVLSQGLRICLKILAYSFISHYLFMIEVYVRNAPNLLGLITEGRAEVPAFVAGLRVIAKYGPYAGLLRNADERDILSRANVRTLEAIARKLVLPAGQYANFAAEITGKTITEERFEEISTLYDQETTKSGLPASVTTFLATFVANNLEAL